MGRFDLGSFDCNPPNVLHVTCMDIFPVLNTNVIDLRIQKSFLGGRGLCSFRPGVAT